MRLVSGDRMPVQSLLPDLKHLGKQPLLLSSLGAREWQMDFRLTGARADRFALVLETTVPSLPQSSDSQPCVNFSLQNTWGASKCEFHRCTLT